MQPQPVRVGRFFAGDTNAPFVQVLETALQQLQQFNNVQFESGGLLTQYGNYDDDPAVLDQKADILVNANPAVNVLFAGSTNQALALVKAEQSANKSIPIIIGVTGDRDLFPASPPVGGTADHPHGTDAATNQVIGQIQYLRNEIGSDLTRIAVLLNEKNHAKNREANYATGVANGMGIEVSLLRESKLFTDPNPLQTLQGDFRQAKAEGAQGLIVIEDPLITGHIADVLTAADDAVDGLPAIYGPPGIVQSPPAGAPAGLMAYGPDHDLMFQRAAQMLFDVAVQHQPVQFINLPLVYVHR
jgi:hypothetical protein